MILILNTFLTVYLYICVYITTCCSHSNLRNVFNWNFFISINTNTCNFFKNSSDSFYVIVILLIYS